MADLRQTCRSRVWGGDLGGFSLNPPISTILKLIIFSRNLFNQKAALILCLGDASVKQHLLLCGEL